MWIVFKRGEVVSGYETLEVAAAAYAAKGSVLGKCIHSHRRSVGASAAQNESWCRPLPTRQTSDTLFPSAGAGSSRWSMRKRPSVLLILSGGPNDYFTRNDYHPVSDLR